MLLLYYSFRQLVSHWLWLHSWKRSQTFTTTNETKQRNGKYRMWLWAVWVIGLKKNPLSCPYATGFLAILVFIAKMQSKHLDTGCKPSVQIKELSILKRLELLLSGLIIFLMIKGAVDNRLVFIRKVWLYNYSFVCWFYNLHQEHGKNIFQDYLMFFEENAGFF